MKKQTWIVSLALAVVVLAQLACNLPNPEEPNPAATLDALYTQSAQTLEAMATQAAQTSIPTQGFASPTPLSTSTFVPGVNTPTPFPPIKTNTPITRCDWAAFVTDPAWHWARDESERDGQIIANISSQLLTPTAFSSVK